MRNIFYLDGRELEAHTVEVGRSNEGNVNTKVSVVRGAVKTQVDAKRDRGPRWVVLATIEANLHTTKTISDERTPGERRAKDKALRTLFAGFDFNFSNILIDSCFDARAVMVAIPGRGER